MGSPKPNRANENQDAWKTREKSQKQAHEDDFLMTLHPAQQDLLGFFQTAHLPSPLAEVVEPFRNLAFETARRGFGGPHGAQTTKAIDHLLLAKDAAVRAAVRG